MANITDATQSGPWGPPYLLYLGNAHDDLAIKTARGLLHWRPEWCIGQYRGEHCKPTLGLRDLTVVQAKAEGANTMVIGTASAGGGMAPEIVADAIAALDAGLNVVAGLHHKLRENPAIVAAARRNGRVLFDARDPVPGIPVGNGLPRAGRRLLTVGTDCSVGKMYTTLAIERAMHHRGLLANFRATGQTGIFVAGSGIPIDAVVADFISGGAEWVSPARSDGGWDLIEGQGSLFHPSYAGVSLGLLHGSQPDALVLCHEPTRRHMRGLPHFPLPDLKLCLEANLDAARLTNPEVKAVGVALNTSGMSPADAEASCRQITDLLGLPCQDPVSMGVETIVDNLLADVLRELSIEHRRFPLVAPFRIARGVKHAADVVTVELRQSGKRGRGESVPYARYGESVASVIETIETLRAELVAGMGRDELQARLPAGAARNALDAAMWDLESQLGSIPVWTQLARPDRSPLVSAFTVSIDTPELMQAAASRMAGMGLIKIKVDADNPAARIEAVRNAAPSAQLIVDPNESWTIEILRDMQAILERAGVDLLEQPLPANADNALLGFNSRIPICADEACHVTSDLPRLRDRYQAVNIKLDKTGGLTEAWRLMRAARADGFKIMVGCMMCSSLGIAPALEIAREADFVDLDGPLWLQDDYPGGVTLKEGMLLPPSPAFSGG